MKKLAAAAVTALMALAPLAGPAGAVEDYETIVLNDYDTKSESFTSEPATGTGVTFFADGTAPGVTYECDGSLTASCDYYLLEVTGVTPEQIAEAAASGTKLSDSVNVNFSIDNYSPVLVADFDLQIFESDADGTKGPELSQSGNNPGDPESVNASVSTSTDAPTGYLLVEVVHFASVATTYDVRVTAS